MDRVKTIGISLFIGGIILLFAYGLYLGFEELMESFDMIFGIFLGLIIIGLIIIIISTIIEQRRDTKVTMKNIKKGDLKPWLL